MPLTNNPDYSNQIENLIRQSANKILADSGMPAPRYSIQVIRNPHVDDNRFGGAYDIFVGTDNNDLNSSYSMRVRVQPGNGSDSLATGNNVMAFVEQNAGHQAFFGDMFSQNGVAVTPFGAKDNAIASTGLESLAARIGIGVSRYIMTDNPVKSLSDFIQPAMSMPTQMELPSGNVSLPGSSYYINQNASNENVRRLAAQRGVAVVRSSGGYMDLAAQVKQLSSHINSRVGNPDYLPFQGGGIKATDDNQWTYMMPRAVGSTWINPATGLISVDMASKKAAVKNYEMDRRDIADPLVQFQDKSGQTVALPLPEYMNSIGKGSMLPQVFRQSGVNVTPGMDRESGFVETGVYALNGMIQSSGHGIYQLDSGLRNVLGQNDATLKMGFRSSQNFSIPLFQNGKETTGNLANFLDAAKNLDFKFNNIAQGRVFNVGQSAELFSTLGPAGGDRERIVNSVRADNRPVVYTGTSIELPSEWIRSGDGYVDSQQQDAVIRSVRSALQLPQNVGVSFSPQANNRGVMFRANTIETDDVSIKQGGLKMGPGAPLIGYNAGIYDFSGNQPSMRTAANVIGEGKNMIGIMRSAFEAQPKTMLSAMGELYGFKQGELESMVGDSINLQDLPGIVAKKIGANTGGIAPVSQFDAGNTANYYISNGDQKWMPFDRYDPGSMGSTEDLISSGRLYQLDSNQRFNSVEGLFGDMATRIAGKGVDSEFYKKYGVGVTRGWLPMDNFTAATKKEFQENLVGALTDTRYWSGLVPDNIEKVPGNMRGAYQEVQRVLAMNEADRRKYMTQYAADIVGGRSENSALGNLIKFVETDRYETGRVTTKGRRQTSPVYTAFLNSEAFVAPRLTKFTTEYTGISERFSMLDLMGVNSFDQGVRNRLRGTLRVGLPDYGNLSNMTPEQQAQNILYQQRSSAKSNIDSMSASWALMNAGGNGNTLPKITGGSHRILNGSDVSHLLDISASNAGDELSFLGSVVGEEQFQNTGLFLPKTGIAFSSLSGLLQNEQLAGGYDLGSNTPVVGSVSRESTIVGGALRRALMLEQAMQNGEDVDQSSIQQIKDNLISGVYAKKANGPDLFNYESSLAFSMRYSQSGMLQRGEMFIPDDELRNMAGLVQSQLTNVMKTIDPGAKVPGNKSMYEFLRNTWNESKWLYQRDPNPVFSTTDEGGNLSLGSSYMATALTSRDPKMALLQKAINESGMPSAGLYVSGMGSEQGDLDRDPARIFPLDIPYLKKSDKGYRLAMDRYSRTWNEGTGQFEGASVSERINRINKRNGYSEEDVNRIFKTLGPISSPNQALVNSLVKPLMVSMGATDKDSVLTKTGMMASESIAETMHLWNLNKKDFMGSSFNTYRRNLITAGLAGGGGLDVLTHLSNKFANFYQSAIDSSMTENSSLGTILNSVVVKRNAKDGIYMGWNQKHNAVGPEGQNVNSLTNKELFNLGNPFKRFMQSALSSIGSEDVSGTGQYMDSWGLAALATPFGDTAVPENYLSDKDAFNQLVVDRMATNEDYRNRILANQATFDKALKGANTPTIRATRLAATAGQMFESGAIGMNSVLGSMALSKAEARRLNPRTPEQAETAPTNEELSSLMVNVGGKNKKSYLDATSNATVAQIMDDMLIGHSRDQFGTTDTINAARNIPNVIRAYRKAKETGLLADPNVSEAFNMALGPFGFQQGRDNSAFYGIDSEGKVIDLLNGSEDELQSYIAHNIDLAEKLKKGAYDPGVIGGQVNLRASGLGNLISKKYKDSALATSASEAMRRFQVEGSGPLQHVVKGFAAASGRNSFTQRGSDAETLVLGQGFKGSMRSAGGFRTNTEAIDYSINQSGEGTLGRALFDFEKDTANRINNGAYGVTEIARNETGQIVSGFHPDLFNVSLSDDGSLNVAINDVKTFNTASGHGKADFLAEGNYPIQNSIYLKGLTDRLQGTDKSSADFQNRIAEQAALRDASVKFGDSAKMGKSQKRFVSSQKAKYIEAMKSGNYNQESGWFTFTSPSEKGGAHINMGDVEEVMQTRQHFTLSNEEIQQYRSELGTTAMSGLAEAVEGGPESMRVFRELIRTQIGRTNGLGQSVGTSDTEIQSMHPEIFGRKDFTQLLDATFGNMSSQQLNTAHSKTTEYMKHMMGGMTQDSPHFKALANIINRPSGNKYGATYSGSSNTPQVPGNVVPPASGGNNGNNGEPPIIPPAQAFPEPSSNNGQGNGSGMGDPKVFAQTLAQTFADVMQNTQGQNGWRSFVKSGASMLPEQQEVAKMILGNFINETNTMAGMMNYAPKLMALTPGLSPEASRSMKNMSFEDAYALGADELGIENVDKLFANNPEFVAKARALQKSRRGIGRLVKNTYNYGGFNTLVRNAYGITSDSTSEEVELADKAAATLYYSGGGKEKNGYDYLEESGGLEEGIRFWKTGEILDEAGATLGKARPQLSKYDRERSRLSFIHNENAMALRMKELVYGYSRKYEPAIQELTTKIAGRNIDIQENFDTLKSAFANTGIDISEDMTNNQLENLLSRKIKQRKNESADAFVSRATALETIRGDKGAVSAIRDIQAARNENIIDLAKKDQIAKNLGTGEVFNKAEVTGEMIDNLRKLGKQLGETENIALKHKEALKEVTSKTESFGKVLSKAMEGTKGSVTINGEEVPMSQVTGNQYVNQLTRSQRASMIKAASDAGRSFEDLDAVSMGFTDVKESQLSADETGRMREELSDSKSVSGAARRLFSGFGLMYLRSIGNIIGGGLERGYGESLKRDELMSKSFGDSVGTGYLPDDPRIVSANRLAGVGGGGGRGLQMLLAEGTNPTTSALMGMGQSALGAFAAASYIQPELSSLVGKVPVLKNIFGDKPLSGSALGDYSMKAAGIAAAVTLGGNIMGAAYDKAGTTAQLTGNRNFGTAIANLVPYLGAGINMLTGGGIDKDIANINTVAGLTKDMDFKDIGTLNDYMKSHPNALGLNEAMKVVYGDVTPGQMAKNLGVYTSSLLKDEKYDGIAEEVLAKSINLRFKYNLSGGENENLDLSAMYQAGVDPERMGMKYAGIFGGGASSRFKRTGEFIQNHEGKNVLDALNANNLETGLGYASQVSEANEYLYAGKTEDYFKQLGNLSEGQAGLYAYQKKLWWSAKQHGVNIAEPSNMMGYMTPDQLRQATMEAEEGLTRWSTIDQVSNNLSARMSVSERIAYEQQQFTGLTDQQVQAKAQALTQINSGISQIQTNAQLYGGMNVAAATTYANGFQNQTMAQIGLANQVFQQSGAYQQDLLNLGMSGTQAQAAGNFFVNASPQERNLMATRINNAGTFANNLVANWGVGSQEAQQYGLAISGMSQYQRDVFLGASQFDAGAINTMIAKGWSMPGQGQLPYYMATGEIGETGFLKGKLTGQALFSNSMGIGNPGGYTTDPVTGQQVATGLTGAQVASSIFGANWASNPYVNSMVNGITLDGVSSPLSGQPVQLRGMAALNWQQQEMSYNQQMYSIWNQKQNWNINYEGTHNLWGIQDWGQQISWNQQEFSMDQQQRQMNLQSKQYYENMALQKESTELNRGYTMQSWNYQDQVRDLQWGWKQEDFSENVRFLTGRQRKIAERQNKRDTILHGMEGDEIENQRDQQKKNWKLEDERFALQKRQYEEQKKLQQEALDQQRVFFAESKQQQIALREAQRAMWEEQMQLQQQSIEYQERYAQQNMEVQKIIIALQQANRNMPPKPGRLSRLFKSKEIRLLPWRMNSFRQPAKEWSNSLSWPIN